jgi:hypothetical protein
VSSKAINFWAFQKQTELEYHQVENKKLLGDIQKLEKLFNDKMLEAANQIKYVVNVVLAELHSLMKHQITTMR